MRGHCENGGGIGGLGASVTVLNSLFRDNSGTSTGGAIALDGNYMELRIDGTTITGSRAPGGSAIAYTSNDHTGILRISHSYLVNGKDRYDTRPGVFFIGRAGGLQIDRYSTVKVR
jgi:predicted outer membrane repeat protein